MLLPYDWLVFCSATLLAVIGGASVTGAMRCTHDGLRTGLQRLYIACLVGVGATTMLALTLHNNCWLCCAIAYACLSVGATIDVGGKAKVTATF